MGKAAAKNNDKHLFDTEERPMSEEDRIKVGDELAEVEQQIVAVKDEKRTVSSAYRVKIHRLEERASVLSKQWTDGVVEVSFEVLEVHDDKRLMVTIERKDTGRAMSTRQMTEPEKEAARKRLQGKLPLDDDGIIEDADVPSNAVTEPGTTRAKGKAKGKGKGNSKRMSDGAE
jgi:hypothetical protein